MPSTYTRIGRFIPQYPPRTSPKRIVLIQPCCIGDVIMATPTLKALRRGYPDAHITWAVGQWSRRAIENHDLLDATLDTGPHANPAKTLGGLWRFVALLRAGNFDLAVSLVRSPLMSLAVLLSGIPHRAGLDSAGRGFGYTLRVPVDPQAIRHEAGIYLDVARALGLDTTDCYANVPIEAPAAAEVRYLLAARGISGAYIVINPTGGDNPGMTMPVKRWPLAHMAALADHLTQAFQQPIVLIGGPADQAIVESVAAQMKHDSVSFSGVFSFPQIAALAYHATGYIGNDTGLTHLAAAAGARTVMILGPSDPARYAPFSPDAITLWKPTRVNAAGVSAGIPANWDWARDGICLDEVIEKTTAFLKR